MNIFELIRIKLETIEFITKTKHYACGRKIYDELLKLDLTIMKHRTSQKEQQKFASNWDCLSLGKYWYYSELLPDATIIPFRYYTAKLKQELQKINAKR